MSKAELINKVLPLDKQLAISILRNDQLSARLKVASLLKELNLQTSTK